MATVVKVGGKLVPLPTGLTDALRAFERAVRSNVASSIVDDRDALIDEIGRFGELLLAQKWPSDRAFLAHNRLRAAIENTRIGAEAALTMLNDLPGLDEPPWAETAVQTTPAAANPCGFTWESYPGSTDTRVCLRAAGHDGVHDDGDGHSHRDPNAITVWWKTCDAPHPSQAVFCRRREGHDGQHSGSGRCWPQQADTPAENGREFDGIPVAWLSDVQQALIMRGHSYATAGPLMHAHAVEMRDMHDTDMSPVDAARALDLADAEATR